MLKPIDMLAKANETAGHVSGIIISIAGALFGVILIRGCVKVLTRKEPVISIKEKETAENKKPTSKKKSSSKTTTQTVDCNSETK